MAAKSKSVAPSSSTENDDFSYDSDSDSEPEPELRVSCLSGLVDLEKLCKKSNLKLSNETNKFMVYQTLKKLGPHIAQKVIGKLVDRGDIKWDNNEDFEVEAIVDHYYDEDGTKYYRIKWKGWGSQHNTWEPIENLECQELIQEYNNTLNTRRGFKRKCTQIEVTESKKSRLDELFEKLQRFAGDISPQIFLSVKPAEIGTMGMKKIMKNGLVKTLNGQEGSMPVLKKLKRAPNYTNKKSQGYKLAKKEVQKALKTWERSINKLNTDPAAIVIENDVDLEGPPAHFQFTSDYIEGAGITIPQDPLIGCECGDCHSERKHCCPANMGTEFSYFKWKRVRVPPGTPIYECNKRCCCGKDCPNRVVQLGRKFKVAIFRTENRGWGVKTLQNIKRGSFVMEYVGEVITSEEAESRGHVYDAEGMTYLFDLDFNDGDNPYTVDARNYGNVSHFVNHSCDPNMAVYGVWINTLDPSLPRIAMFSTRNIKKGEELTFDYMMKVDPYNKSGSQNMSALDENDNITLSESDADAAAAQDAASDVSSTPTKEQPQKQPPSPIISAQSLPQRAQLLRSPSKQSPLKENGLVGEKLLSSPDRSKKSLVNSLMASPKANLIEEEISRLMKSTPKMKSLTKSPVKAQLLKKCLDTSLVKSVALNSQNEIVPNLSRSPIKSQLSKKNLDGLVKSVPLKSRNEIVPTVPLTKTSNEELVSVPGDVPKDDQEVKVSAAKKHRLVCQCGSAKCRGFLF